MAYTRRRFLRNSVVGTALAGGGWLPLLFPRSGRADPVWGDFKADVMPGVGPYKILEIHCYGAPSIWETLWVSKNGNTPDFRGFDQEMAELDWLCPNAPGAAETTEFATDALGKEIHWGPASKPLWPFKDRVRMVVQQHPAPNIPIHEASVPFAITGTRLGDPRHASAGAAIQHRGIILEPTRTLPHSYAFFTGTPAAISNMHRAMVAVGRHPSAAKPLAVRLYNAADLTDRLARATTNDERDALLDIMRGTYRDRLRFHALNVPPVRSEEFQAYDAAISSAFGAPELAALFPQALLTVPTTPYCVKRANGPDPADRPNNVAAAISLAQSLLTNPDNPARHVLIADTGVETLGGQPCYDTHLSTVDSAHEQVRATVANLYNLFQHLAEAIDPTGTDPTKINLNDTLVVINTEFGRTPTPSGSGDDRGREHWEEGYVGLLIGGPITSAGIAGGLDANGVADAANWFSPTDFRSAVFLAAGVWPFEPEIYGTSNSGPNILVGTEDGNAANLVSRVLGLT